MNSKVFITAMMFSLKLPLALGQSGPLRPFAAIVQFVEGSATKTFDKSTARPIVFKDTITQEESFELSVGSLLKMITENDCVGVVYGPAKAFQDKERIWRIEGRGARWICGEDRTSVLHFQGHKLVITAGEILVFNNQLVIITGAGRFNGEPVVERTVYQISSSGLKRISAEAWDVAQLNNQAKQPVESLKLPKVARPEIKRPLSDRRLMIGFSHGKAKIIHEDSNLDGDEAKLDQVVIQWQRSNHLFALSYTSLDESSRSCCTHRGAVSKLESFTAEIGYRFYSRWWWSPFVRGGVSAMRNQLSIHRQDVNHYSSRDIEYVGAVLRGGSDVIYEPQWLWGFGIFGTLELNAARTLWTSAETLTRRSSGAPAVSEEKNTDGGITALGYNFTIGVTKSF